MKNTLPAACALFFLFAALASCGGGGGGDGDELVELTAEEIQAIANAVTSASQAIEEAVGTQADGLGASKTFSVSTQSTCPAGGLITGEGEIALAYDAEAGASSASGEVLLKLSAHASAEDDCRCADLTLDGSLTLTVSGHEAACEFPVTGSIGIERVGEDGEILRMAEGCQVALTYAAGAVTGTICGNAL